jgi:phage terminase large subunit
MLKTSSNSNDNNSYTLSMQKIIGKGYNNGWWTNCKARYRLYKGARNSKKTYNMLGQESINKILTQPLRNILIIRQTENSHKITTWNTILSVINQPDFRNPEISLSRFFKVNSVDKIITYIPTGQVIVFRGFDNADKLTSLKATVGFFTDVYIEEAFEIKDYDEFRKLDGSIRGKLPKGYFFQITFLFNAWNKEHWLYDKFFKGNLEDDYQELLLNDYIDYHDPNYIGDYGKGLYLHISTYKVNEFRDTNIYDLAMENLRIKAPEIYKVEALGMWGVTGERVYPEWNDSCIAEPQKIMLTRFGRFAIGIDTGLSDATKNKTSKSATTMVLSGLTWDRKRIIATDEYYHSNAVKKKTEPEIMQEIINTLKMWQIKYQSHQDLMKGQVFVYVDSADIGFREGLEYLARQNNMYNFVFLGSTKYPISRRVYFIRVLMAHGNYLVSSLCPNLIREHKTAVSGEKGEIRLIGDDHTQDAMEYSWSSYVNELQLWHTIKI